MNGPTKAKKAPKVAAKNAQSFAQKKQAASAMKVSVKTARGGSVPVAFKPPERVVKGLLPPGDRAQPRAPIKNPLSEKPVRAPKSPVRSVESKASVARPSPKSAKEFYPVFTAWPKRPTKADIENVSKHFANRSEGCID